MASKVFAETTDRLWSNPANWGGSLPEAWDEVSIPAGEVCEFDVDHSDFDTYDLLDNVMIDGELYASTTPGAYLLKADYIGGEGVLRAGSAQTPYPLDCRFNIEGPGIELQSPNACQIYCQEPAHKFVTLTADASIGETVLSIDTDLTADIWAAGDEVAIYVSAGQDAGIYVIDGITSTSITLESGLYGDALAGARVYLVSRNVRIENGGFRRANGGHVACLLSTYSIVATYPTAGDVSGVFFGGVMLTMEGSGPLVGCNISAAVLARDYWWYECGIFEANGCTFSGDIVGFWTGLRDCGSCVISGDILYCSTGIERGHELAISGDILYCSTGIESGHGLIISGDMIGCGSDLVGGGGHMLSGRLGNPNINVDGVSEFRALGAHFEGATEFEGYNGERRAPYHYAESIDHNGVAGAYRAWCKGGVVNSVVSPAPAGHDAAYELACESADHPVFRRWALQVQPGAKLTVSAWLRKDVSMAYLPRVQIVDQFADPLVASSHVALAEQAMTDSVDTWEEVEVSWQNTGAMPRDVWIRAIGQASSGNVYAAATWEAIDVTLLADVAEILGRLGTPVGASLSDDIAAVADDVLLRDWTGLTGAVPDRSTLNALRFLRNKWAVDDDELTVMEEDDSTPAWTATLTTASAAEPIVAVDPD